MSRARKIRRVVVLSTAFVAGLWIADRWMATRSLADDAATQATSQPATSRPVVAADVQPILDRLATTYKTFPLRIEGEIASDFDIAGIVDNKKLAIAAAAQSPQAYRHEAKDKLLVTSDGTKLHLFDIAANQYADAKVGDEAIDATSTRSDARMILLEQDPALFIALGNDPVEATSLDGAAVSLSTPATEDGRVFDRVVSAADGIERTIWVDRERGTIDRVAYDFAGQLAARGAAQVKRASVTLRYMKTEFGGAPPDSAIFAFAPPADATPIVRGGQGGEMLTGEPSALEGKVAADFELKDIDGKTVKLSDAKGSVVVLDFWATWCPPCRAGLPHLAAASEKYKAKGVKVYAVNQQEERETVAKFLAEQKLSLVALLDADGEVGKKYGVSGIPQTVVIGRDGNILKVFVGFNESDTNALPTAIEAALN
jgi:peroxiredoxin